MAEIYFPLFNKNRVESVLFLVSPGFSVPQSFDGLRDRLQSVRGNTIIFPSHLFESQYQQEIKEYLGEESIDFWVQVSLGAELFDYQEDIKKWASLSGFCGVEVLADRRLSETHLRQIKDLGCEYRFVCVPRADLRPVEFLRDFPKEWSGKIAVYFPTKQSSSDERLSNEEIFLLTAKLRDLRPDLTLRPAAHLENYHESIFEQAAADRRFREGPSVETLEGVIADQNRSIVKLSSLSLAKKGPMLPAIVLPYGFLWILHDPGAAISSVFRLLRHPLRMFHRVKDVFVWLGYRAVELLYLIRHIIIMGHVYLWRSKSVFVVSAIKFFYGVVGLVRSALLFLRYGVLYRIYFGIIHWIFIRGILFAKNPTWYLQLAFPKTYWLITYPPKKIYWFLEYQYRKRVLRHGFK